MRSIMGISFCVMLLGLSSLTLASGSSSNEDFANGGEFHFDFGNYHYKFYITGIIGGAPVQILDGCLEFYDSTGVIDLGCIPDIHWFPGTEPGISGSGWLDFSCYRIYFDTYGSGAPTLYKFDEDANEFTKVDDGDDWSYHDPQ